MVEMLKLSDKHCKAVITHTQNASRTATKRPEKTGKKTDSLSREIEDITKSQAKILELRNQ